MKFTIHGRPPTPGNHAADHGSDYANEYGAEDVHGSPSRVQQPGGGPSEQADHCEYEKVPYGAFAPFVGRFQEFQ
jgi:hypothetical protein